jgi:hypothetical protein
MHFALKREINYLRKLSLVCEFADEPTRALAMTIFLKPEIVEFPPAEEPIQK